MRIRTLVTTLAAFAPVTLGAQGTTTPAARYDLAEQYSKAHAGDALLIWENGRLVFQQYDKRFHKGQAHRLNSGSKSFNGLMAIAAMEDGLLRLDEPVSNTITEWKSDPQKSRITIGELLHLISGLDTHILQAAGYADAINARMIAPPGTQFRYGPTAFQVFGALLQRKLGSEPVTAYLERRVLSPIGAHVAKWDTAKGSNDPQLAGGAWMTADDWMRVGLMLLGRGTLDGHTVVRPDDFALLTNPTTTAPSYGLSVWLNAAVAPSDPFLEELPSGVSADGPRGLVYDGGPNDLFMAAGLFNQRLYVIPSRNTVIVRFGRMDFSWDDGDFLARALDGVVRPPKPRPTLLQRIRENRRRARQDEEVGP